MFFVDECGTIKITKGDTAQLDVILEDSCRNPYTLESGDTLTLTVRERAVSDSAVLLRSTSNTACITLNAEDTAKLPIGKLSYDVQLEKVSGERYTVAGASRVNPMLKNFWVLPEVTI